MSCLNSLLSCLLLRPCKLSDIYCQALGLDCLPIPHLTRIGNSTVLYYGSLSIVGSRVHHTCTCLIQASSQYMVHSKTFSPEISPHQTCIRVRTPPLSKAVFVTALRLPLASAVRYLCIMMEYGEGGTYDWKVLGLRQKVQISGVYKGTCRTWIHVCFLAAESLKEIGEVFCKPIHYISGRRLSFAEWIKEIWQIENEKMKQ